MNFDQYSLKIMFGRAVVGLLVSAIAYWLAAQVNPEFAESVRPFLRELLLVIASALLAVDIRAFYEVKQADQERRDNEYLEAMNVDRIP